MSASNVTVHAKDSEKGIWAIRVERRYNGELAVGEVEVLQQDAPGAEHAPHAALAASRAWMALAERLLARGVRDSGATVDKSNGKSNMGSDMGGDKNDTTKKGADTDAGNKDIDGAIFCIQQGLEELGDSYSNSEIIPIKDDTDLKLAKAEDLLRQGRTEDGARMMLRVLQTRIALYVDLHKKHGKVRVIK